ncbi:MAG: hypothetical protein ABSE79_18415 [Terriglobia bacterium]|jgi:hypothetical protein
MRLSFNAATVLLLLPLGALAQEIPNFSGAWVLAWPEPEVSHGRKLSPAELRVVQKEHTLQATFLEHGKARTCTYYLDGTESKNLAAGGAPSKDTATVQYATLLIKSTVEVPKATLQIEQKWQVSADSRHLIVQITANASSAAVAGFPLGSWENVYNRKAPAEIKSQNPAVKRTRPSSR